MGLQLADIGNDPLVKETLAIFMEAVDESAPESEWSRRPPREYLEPDLENPIFKILAETDALDSATAAGLACEHLLNWASLESVEKKLQPDVLEVIKFMNNEQGVAPEELVAKATPTGLKLLIASFAASTTSDDFKQMLAEAHPVELRMALSEISGLMTDIADRMLEDKSWQAIPPKLLDRYMDGMANLANATPGRAQKRFINMLISDLKTDVAKTAAAEIAALTPAPVIDPESPFVQLKNNARKFKPGGLNG